MNQVGEEERNFTSERNNYKGGDIYGDILEEEISRRSKAAEQVVITESLIVASVFGKEKWAEGYGYVQSQLKDTHESIANQIEI